MNTFVQHAFWTYYSSSAEEITCYFSHLKSSGKSETCYTNIHICGEFNKFPDYLCIGI